MKRISSVKTQLTLFYLLTLATCFALDQSIIRPLTQGQIAGIMYVLHVTLLLCFCGIPHHSYHYHKILIVKDPLLWLEQWR